jgi:PAP2 superfamily
MRVGTSALLYPKAALRRPILLVSFKAINRHREIWVVWRVSGTKLRTGDWNTDLWLPPLCSGRDCMPHRGIIMLPPSRADLAVSQACARAVTPAIERALQVVTWLADEKVVLGAAVLFWTYTRLGRRSTRPADHMLWCVALAGVLPHLFKRLVDRKRPDRVVVHVRRHGIPRSGNAWDSFPSGHALHLGAIARPLTRLCPDRFRILVWPSVIALAATRIMLLAHYVSDVVAGLILGAVLDSIIGRNLASDRQISNSPAARMPDK